MYESIIEDVLPLALMVGVEYDLFWTLNPSSLNPFIKAFEMKRKAESERDNVVAWQNGVYIQMAIASTLNKSFQYPKEPLGFGKEDNEPVDMTKKIKNIMLERMAIVNTRLGEGETVNE